MCDPIPQSLKTPTLLFCKKHSENLFLPTTHFEKKSPVGHTNSRVVVVPVLNWRLEPPPNQDRKQGGSTNMRELRVFSELCHTTRNIVVAEDPVIVFINMLKIPSLW